MQDKVEKMMQEKEKMLWENKELLKAKKEENGTTYFPCPIVSFPPLLTSFGVS